MDGGVDGSVDRSVVWGRLVGRARVGNALVLDVSDVSAVAIGVSSVVDNLGAAIRKGNGVGASHGLGVGSLLLGKVGARVVVMDTVLESVGLGGLIIAAMVGGWGVVDWSVDWGVDRGVDGSVDGAGGVGG